MLTLAPGRYPRSRAIVLSVYRSHEKDLRAVLLHERDGKRWLLARGGRASRKGVAAALQPGNAVDVLLYRRGDQDTLQQIEICASPFERVNTPARLYSLHYLLWITEHWCEWSTPVSALYGLLQRGITTVCDLGETQLADISRRYERALLVEEGLWRAEQPLSPRDFRRIFEEHRHRQLPRHFVV